MSSNGRRLPSGNVAPYDRLNNCKRRRKGKKIIIENGINLWLPLWVILHNSTYTRSRCVNTEKLHFEYIYRTTIIPCKWINGFIYLWSSLQELASATWQCSSEGMTLLCVSPSLHLAYWQLCPHQTQLNVVCKQVGQLEMDPHWSVELIA